jgi:hypothetical protein
MSTGDDNTVTQPAIRASPSMERPCWVPPAPFGLDGPFPVRRLLWCREVAWSGWHYASCGAHVGEP